MSTRTTPAPSYRYPTPNSAPLRSRQVSSASSLNTPSGERSRRVSSFSQRKYSQQSASGTLTPTTTSPYARKRSTALENVEERAPADWSVLEPDEIFRRLPVGEVKRVETKMREEALNKQSELRAMVGTRYRDLLTSATQITALRESSLRLAEALQDAARSCLSPQGPDLSKPEIETGEGDEAISLLPVAAHMKVLLDAPEAMYSFLAHHAFLRAAFLWLVSRVVKESLASMHAEDNEPYTALMRQQWETLLPFRGQIVQRATASLRSREALSSKTLSETLLAIILLDNLSIPDALSLFLTQRTKALRDILYPESSRYARTRRDSRVSVRSVNKERDEIGAVLGESVKSLLETVQLIEAVFAKRPHAESLIQELQRLVQIGEPLPSPKKEFMPRRTSHERRASRLASISLTIPPVSSSGGGPPASALQVIQVLPSSQILLRHLPNNITAFTPFIAPSSTPDLQSSVADWQQQSIDLLREAVPEWLGALNSVADVWRVRADLNALLQDGHLQEQITAALEEQWGKRVQEVWERKMVEIVQLADAKTRAAVGRISSSGEENDTYPESFIFADLAFPPAPTNALTASSAPSNNFLSAVRKRTALRTPALDEVLVSLESFAQGIRQELAELPVSLHQEYGRKVQVVLQNLVNTLQSIVEDLSEGNEGKPVEAEMFVGRVAIYLATQSSCLADLVGESTASLGQAKTDLIAVHSTSVKRWRKKAIADAIALLAPIFDSHRGPPEVAASWQGPHPISPSAPIMDSLLALVSSTRQLGLPPRTDLSVVEELVKGYVESAKSLDEWSSADEESAAQAAFDISFLNLLVSGDSAKYTMVEKFTSKIPPSLPETFVSDLPALVTDHLRRTQLLLHPLIKHLDTTHLKSSAPAANARNGLLRFGAPKVSRGVGTEFRSPLAVAKPGKRFGLLSIAA